MRASFRPFAGFRIPRGAASQAVRNPIRLPEGLGFTSPGCLLEPVIPPVNHSPLAKVNCDDLGHVVSIPSGKPVRPRLVQAT